MKTLDKTKLPKRVKRELAAYAETGDPGARTVSTGRHKFSRNCPEDSLIEAIDQRNFLTKYATWIEKIRDNKFDVPTALQDLSQDMLIQLAYMALSAEVSNKTRLAALQDWLDRAGYGKVQKHALATVDASQSKEALISLLLGSSKDLEKQGIKIIDDTEQSDPKKK